jgi:MYXO-CTERM domain-containing protein
MKKLLTVLGTAGFVLSMNRAAAADVIPPEVWACNTLDAGAPCSGGNCQPATCTKLDYTNWDAGSGQSPPSVSYACLKCVDAGLEVDAGTGGDTPQGSCSCRVVGAPRSTSHVAWGGLLGVALAWGCRRRLARSRG